MPAETLPALADSLRVARRRTALLAALADLGGAWGLADVTAALTALADRAARLGLTPSSPPRRPRQAPRRHRGRPPRGRRHVRPRHGQDGRRELDYSSDIDLIVLFERDLATTPTSTLELPRLHPASPRKR